MATKHNLPHLLPARNLIEVQRGLQKNSHRAIAIKIISQSFSSLSNSISSTSQNPCARSILRRAWKLVATTSEAASFDQDKRFPDRPNSIDYD